MRHSQSDHVTEHTERVDARDVRAELDRILQSRFFRNSERLQRFLKFAVECTLEGATDQLKESVIGRTVFDRGSEYDPRTDSIVRVESQRLRRRLREYYEIEGRGDPVSLVFQPGSYIPAFAYLTDVHVSSDEEPGEPVPAPSPSPETIAVLPLSNLSGDPRQEFFCDGITDDIISALSSIPGLNVIGHASVFALKAAALDAREIGRRLAAGTVIDGSVRKSRSRLKIFVEMIDAPTGQVRWAQTFERTLKAVFRVEEEIAQTVAQFLQATLPVSGRLIRGAPNMDAYQLYLHGQYELHRMSGEGFRAAANLFERAVSLFPTYAPPYAGLADAYSYLAFWGYARPRDVFPKAQRSALQALKLDASLPHANTSLAVVTGFYEWKWKEATALARKATKFEPSYAFGQQIYGCCLLVLGELDQACAQLERGIVLDPLSVRAHRLLGWGLYLQRRTFDAEKWLQAALVLDREPTETRYLLAQVCLSEGRFTEALEHARLSQTDPPNPLSLGVLGACLAHLNHREEAFEIIETLSRQSEAAYVDPRAIADVQIALNNTEGAIESLRRILDERSPWGLFLKLDPQLDPLRSNPQFAALVAEFCEGPSVSPGLPLSSGLPEADADPADGS